MVASVVVAALLVTGGVVYARRDTSSVRYRTTAATLGTVTQTITLSGNLTPSGETDLDFGSSGRVQTVNVQAGAAVKAGDILATLDPTTLKGALIQAQAALISAQAKLSLDQAGPAAQTLAQAQAQVRSNQVQLQNAQIGVRDTRTVNAQSIAQAASAVTAAQSTLTADQAVLTTDSASPQGAGAQKIISDQQAVSRDQASVNSAQAALSANQGKSQQSIDQAQGQVASAQVQVDNAQAALAALQQGATPQQIQIDQSQVQVAQVGVDSANRSLDQATLTAPVAGTAGQVNLAIGQPVSGSSGASSGGSGGGASASTTTAASSSSTHAIVILNPGAFQVTGTVSDAQVNQVAIGQRARVTAAGSTEAVTGRVTQVASEATITSGVATFPVTVTLDGSNPSLHAGASASISLVVNQVSEVLTVPTSAIQTSGGGTTVQVLVNGAPQSRTVQTGASDPLRTEVTSGLAAGDSIVIATISGTVPTNPTRAGGGLLAPGGGTTRGIGTGGRAAGG